MNLCRRKACQTLPISSTTAWVSPDPLKAQAILLATTVRRSAVEQGAVEIYFKKIFEWKIEFVPLHGTSYVD